MGTPRTRSAAMTRGQKYVGHLSRAVAEQFDALQKSRNRFGHRPGKKLILDGFADHVLGHPDRECASIFNLAGGVRLVAGLVFQPLDEESIVAAVRQCPGQEEAGHLAANFRQREEAIGLGHRAERDCQKNTA
jgi:hypothetical protein